MVHRKIASFYRELKNIFLQTCQKTRNVHVSDIICNFFIFFILLLANPLHGLCCRT